ncbi:MAG: DUF2851 family protein [Bacteroidota bacterium]
MNEDFLHFVWKFQKFSTIHLKTVQNEPLQILDVGQHNFDAGPDFFFGKVVIGGQVWAGTIEIHLQSSNWYTHRHEIDKRYDSVILHVVWEHDMEVRRSDETLIPTLELKPCVDRQVLQNYQKLFSSKQLWINCENQFGKISDFVVKNWLDRLYLERLEDKSKLILDRLESCTNDWEAVLFQLLCKNFGLKVNGDAFLSMAMSLDYKVVKKSRQKLLSLEALFMGQAGLLSEEKMDPYYSALTENYKHAQLKFGLPNGDIVRPKFFRLRPPNFPTIRLSQLANLLYRRPHLFSELISIQTISEFYKVFDISASTYWNTHYNFEVVSARREKRLTKPFIDLLIVNTVIPIKHCHAMSRGRDISEEIMKLAHSIKPEENSIVRKYKMLAHLGSSALESQALLQLKNNYCEKNKCLQCSIGNSILKQ